MNKEVLKSSKGWIALLGAIILEPDGWDRENLKASLEEPITREEFDKRLMHSTINPEGYVPPPPH